MCLWFRFCIPLIKKAAIRMHARANAAYTVTTITNFLLYFDLPRKYGAILITSSIILEVLFLLMVLFSITSSTWFVTVGCCRSVNGFGEMLSNVFSSVCSVWLLPALKDSSFVVVETTAATVAVAIVVAMLDEFVVESTCFDGGVCRFPMNGKLFTGTAEFFQELVLFLR